MSSKSHDNIDEQADRLIAVLNRRCRRRAGDDPRPVSALALARWLGIRPGGSDDSRKRGLRSLITYVRTERDVPIVSCNAGYYLAESVGDYDQYERFLARSGIQQLSHARQVGRSTHRAVAGGQMLMFD